MYIANFEMESSALYGFGKLMNHNVLTVCLVIANRKTGEFSKDYKIKMGYLIEETLYNLKKL
jgi:uridine phosphorylase